MERVRRLYELPRYQEELKAIARAEVSREFCGHTLEHFLDVARLMYIRSLEEGEIVNREVIYAAALLHDLGRGMQYREGIPHQEAGVLLARELLPACRFDEEEIRQIHQACGGRILKVIIETCLLTEEEKIKMCEIVTKAGAEFIKTSTGFSTGGATFADVELMRKHVGKDVKVKAAGGISSFDDAEEFIRLGAERLGTSRLVKIMKNSRSAILHM